MRGVGCWAWRQSGDVFSFTGACRGPPLGWMPHPLVQGWGPLNLLRRMHPLMVTQQKSPVEDSLLKAAGGCPKLSTGCSWLLAVTWCLSHK